MFFVKIAPKTEIIYNICIEFKVWIVSNMGLKYTMHEAG